MDRGLAAGAPLLGLWTCVAALLTAYLRVLGGSLGLPQSFVGPMAKQHRMAGATGLAVGCAVVPGWSGVILAWGLWAIAALSLLTAVRRLLRIAGALRR